MDLDTWMERRRRMPRKLLQNYAVVLGGTRRVGNPARVPGLRKKPMRNTVPINRPKGKYKVNSCSMRLLNYELFWAACRSAVDPCVVSFERCTGTLYGHLDSGVDGHLDSGAHLRAQGVVEIPNWRSVYYHNALSLMLVVYVDDCKMSGPPQQAEKAWALIRSAVKMEAPEPFGLVLGCRHEIGVATVDGVGQVRSVT